jgi:hypothetical protein
MQENPYKKVVGHEVMIIGHHVDKGRVGRAKDISLTGRAKIELKIMPIRFIDVDASNWMVIE